MVGMHDHWHAGLSRGQPSDESRFGRVRVHDVGAELLHQRSQAVDRLEVLPWIDRRSQRVDVQRMDTQIGSQVVHLCFILRSSSSDESMLMVDGSRFRCRPQHVNCRTSHIEPGDHVQHAKRLGAVGQCQSPRSHRILSSAPGQPRTGRRA